MSDQIDVRRARRQDLEAIAALHNASRPAAAPLAATDILLSLAETGYLLAWQEMALCGALAWRAENLVAHVVAVYGVAGAPACTFAQLLVAAEAEARVLSCEVILLTGAEPAVADAARVAGYADAGLAGLPAPWREAAGGLPDAGSGLLLKRLSEKRVGRPI